MGGSWTRIDKGLPSDFGFALVAHPRRGDVAYCSVLNGDDVGRWMPEGQMTVWRTRDAGATWEPLRRGLPGPNAYLTVLRECMACDGADPLGLYVGTTQGHLFASADAGESWSAIAENLPAIIGVSAAVAE